MLVFPVFKQAGEIIEVLVLPGWYPGVVIMVVRVTMTMVVRVTVRVTVGVLFPGGMLMRFSTVPVDVNRAAHGERKGTPERTFFQMKRIVCLFQVKRIVCLCELPTLMELPGLKPPRGKPGGQEGYLKEEESGAGHC